MADHVRVEKSVLDKDPAEVFAFLLDVRNFPRHMPNVNSVEVLSDSGAQRVTRWDTQIEGAPLIWTERDIISPAQLRWDFEATESDFDFLRGSWRVATDAQGTVVSWEMHYAIGLSVIEDIVAPVLKDKIRENLETMLGGLTSGIGAG